MAGFKDASVGLLACVVTLMIPAYLSLAARLYVRIFKKPWGIEDWVMAYAALPLFVECLSGILTAYYGLGQHQANLSAADIKTALLWWNIFSFFYCNSMLPIKLGITLQICRIAQRNPKVLYVLYGMMVFNSITLLGVFIFQLAQCQPVAYNWDKSIPGGKCLDPRYLTNISFAMSGVNITTDWVCALMPIPLLWNVQMDFRRKIGVGALLGLGVFASSAALVRLKYTISLSETDDSTYDLGVLACWTIAEPGIGFLVGNMATLRPLFSQFLGSVRSKYARGSNYNTYAGATSGSKQLGSRYLELGSLQPSTVSGDEKGRVAVNMTRSKRSQSEDSILCEDDNYDKQTAVSHGSGNHITVTREVQVARNVI